MKAHHYHFHLAVVFILFSTYHSFAQGVTINDNGAAANPYAILDINTTTHNKGVLFPRFTSAQLATLQATIAGLTVAEKLALKGLYLFDTDANAYYSYNGINSWGEVLTTINSNNNVWGVTGNAGTVPGTDFLGTTDAKDVVFKSNKAELMRLSTTGNIGIGTVAPSQKLHIFQASGGSPKLLIESNGLTTTDAPGIILDAGAVSTGTSDITFLENGVFKASTGWSTSSSQQYWFVYDGGSNQNMVYKAGSLGIGINSPQHKLHISGLTGTPYVQVTDDITGSASTDGLIMGTNGAGSIYIVNQESAYNMSIGTATDNNLIKLQSSTNYVGIGTGNLAPAAKLDVDGGGSIQVDGNYTYETAKTRYYTLSFSDFDIQDEIAKDWLKTSGSYGTVVTNGTTTATSGSVTAPIHLPNGSVIKEVRWYVSTSSSTTSPNMRLKRTTLGSGTVATLAIAGATTFSGITIVSSVATLTNTTSNASYNYWLRSYLYTGQRLYGARITYTVTKAE